jgi:hypothetical protein
LISGITRFSTARGGVDDVGRFARPAHRHHRLAMAFADAAIQHLFEHRDGIRRNRPQRGDAVHDLRLDVVRQRVQHGGGHFRIKLHQQHRDRLRMFVADQRGQHLGRQPARKFQRRGARQVGRRDALHQAFRLDLAHGAGHQRTDLADAVVRGQAKAFGAFDETGDRLRDRHRADLAQRAHLLAQRPQLFGFQLAKDFRGLLVLKQHDHHRGAFGAADGRQVAHTASSVFSFSIWRRAATALSGFSFTSRWAMPTWRLSSSVSTTPVEASCAGRRSALATSGLGRKRRLRRPPLPLHRRFQPCCASMRPDRASAP